MRCQESSRPPAPANPQPASRYSAAPAAAPTFMISLADSSLPSTPLYVIRSAFTRSWLRFSAATSVVRDLGSLEPAPW